MVKLGDGHEMVRGFRRPGKPKHPGKVEEHRSWPMEMVFHYTLGAGVKLEVSRFKNNNLVDFLT